MRLFYRAFALCAAGLGLAVHTFAAPTNVSITVAGEFVAGRGMTVTDTAATSTLTNGAGTVTYTGTTITQAMNPGDTVKVSLGTLIAADGSPTGVVPFDGANLLLTATLNSPTSFFDEAPYTGDLSGSISAAAGAVSFAWEDPQEYDFTTSDANPKTISLIVEPATSVPSGGKGTDIQATLHLEGDVPPVPGDLDGDGQVTFTDATQALLIWAGFIDSAPSDMPGGDVDGDGFITLDDCVQICRLAAS